MNNKKKKMSLIKKIFIGLFLGILFGYILNALGGKECYHIKEYFLPFLDFVGDLFIRLIRMVVVPLVFFCIIDAAVSLGDLKKLRTIGLKTIVFFLVSGMIAATIGLILVNIFKPGIGIDFGTVKQVITVSPLPGPYETILNMIPVNPFASLASGEMLPIIVFSLIFGLALIALGKKAEIVTSSVKILADTMFHMITLILGIIPYGVFALMAKAIGIYGFQIFGPVLKFILVDYLANFIMVAGVYSLLLVFIASVMFHNYVVL
ncbi:MAG: dicarboxylate/amino acid:cation symporter [Victivallales bacterium]|nr:dicarboxylate/amino acid:cation symporter [Victivallales bacterium]